ncbi:PPE domain-containing protein [Amycolatopsis thermoflava]|uniref:PPE domain-containing protein n=1 Tax=Amycolatopsis thermoflava TaxID=84480 RepID=UPI0036631C4E
MTGAVLGSTASMGAMSGQQIYENFYNAPGPVGLQNAQHGVRTVMKKYEVRSRQITSLIGAMEEGWTGSGADAAKHSVSALAVAHSGAAAAMKTANDLIESQSQAFFDTKNKVVPVPEVPQTPPALKEIIGDSNGDLSQMVKVAAANAAAKQNVEAMQSWSTTSGDNGAKMPTTYGTLDAGVLGVTQGAQPGGGVDIQNKPTSDGPRFGGAGGASRGGGGVTGGTSSLSGPYQAPAGQIPADGRTVASDAAYAPPAAASYSPPQQGAGNYGTPTAYGVPGYGSTAGYRGANPAGGPGAWAGRGGVGSGRGFSAGGAGRGGGFSAGRAGGFGPGSGGNPLSDGKRFGAGNPAAAGESFGRGGGAAGRGGAAGSPGAMGAGAGNRGKGEDDGEHQRKYIVDEDEHFQLTAEGEKAVDPVTGMTVSPPVLGQ